MTTPLGIRRRNPGNLVRSGVDWVGKLPDDGNRFESFDTDEHGILALASNLLAYQRGHGIKTIRQAINRWAPPSENDTGAYVNAVASALGYGPDVPLDFSDPGVLAGLTRAIIRHENGIQPYSDELIAAAIGAALGIRPVDVPSSQIDAGAAISRPDISKPTEKKPMLSLLLPALLPMLPQLISIFGKGGERAAQNAQAAQAVVDAIVKTTGAPNLQAGIEAMQADPAVKAQATAAVLQSPAVAALLEVGGGVTEARKADLATMAQAKPFWTSSAVFWISLLLLPMVYWYVGSMIVGGAVGTLTMLGVEMPSWMVFLLSLFGGEWNGESRSGGFNLVIGLVLGGICGVYYGVSVTQNNQRRASDAAPTNHN